MLGGSAAILLLLCILTAGTLASSGLVVQPARTTALLVTITLTVIDLRTSRSASGGGTLLTQSGEWLQVNGFVSPAPLNGCSKCVQVQMQIQTQGLAWEIDAAPTGYYTLTFIQIPQISADFTVQAVYLPTGATSAPVAVSLTCPVDTQFNPWTGTCSNLKPS
jgi:hypothetical protein